MAGALLRALAKRAVEGDLLEDTLERDELLIVSPVSHDFNGFVYLLEGEAQFGANRQRATRSQIAVLGPGSTLTAVDAQPGTRFVLMAGKPYGEEPIYNGPYVD